MKLKPGMTIIADTANSQYVMTVLETSYRTAFGFDLVKVDIIGGKHFRPRQNSNHQGPAHCVMINPALFKIGSMLTIIKCNESGKDGGGVKTSAITAISFFDDHGDSFEFTPDPVVN